MTGGLGGLGTLVLGVLRYEPNETHFPVGEGLAVVERPPAITWLTMAEFHA